VPRPVLQAKVMQATTCFHDGISNAILQEAYLVCHHSTAFHTANRVFDADSDRRDRTIARFLRWCEFTPTWLFLGLDDRDTVKHKTLESHILIEVTPAWQGITGQSREVLVVFLAFHGVTQEAYVTSLIDYEQVFDRVTFLLTAVVVSLVLWISGAMDRSLSAIMPKRGGRGVPSVRVAASITAKSSALRAGSNS
jgi:hypothetical protein